MNPSTEGLGTRAPVRRRRRMLHRIAAVLLLADVALLGVWMMLRSTHRGGGTPSAEARVAGAFAALRRDGLAAALDTLERLAARDSVALRDAHQLAHALGRQALETTGGDISVLRACRPVFAAGCYHGVVETLLHLRGQLDMANLERMCASLERDEQRGAVYECIHGLGHGVLGAVKFDVEAALRQCDALSSPWVASWCHAGVFMEAISSALGALNLGGAHPHPGAGNGHAAANDDGDNMEHAGHRGHDMPSAGRFALDPNDPYSPCNRFVDPYAASCWIFQGFVILRQHRFNTAQSLQTCDHAPDGRAGRCYESIGFQLTGLLQRDDSWIVSQCQQGRPELAERCAAGAAWALNAMDWSGTRAAHFCATGRTEWKGACYRAVATTLAHYAAPTRWAALCAAVEPAYVEICRRAAARVGEA